MCQLIFQNISFTQILYYKNKQSQAQNKMGDQPNSSQLNSKSKNSSRKFCLCIILIPVIILISLTLLTKSQLFSYISFIMIWIRQVWSYQPKLFIFVCVIVVIVIIIIVRIIWIFYTKIFVSVTRIVFYVRWIVWISIFCVVLYYVGFVFISKTSVQQQIFIEANNIKISVTSDEFYQHQEIVNSSVKASAIGVKILTQIYNMSQESISIKQFASQYKYQGSYIQISPLGKVTQINSTISLWGIFIGFLKQEQISSKKKYFEYKQWYFDYRTFNIILLQKGTLKIKSSIQILNQNITIIHKRKQEILLTINRRWEKLIHLYNVGDNHEQFDIHIENIISKESKVISSIFSVILNKVGIYGTFYGETVNRKVFTDRKYFMFMPNYKIIERSQSINVIEIRQTITQKIYYFSNPELILILPTQQLTTQIKQYCQQTYTYLSQKRLSQKTNNYEIKKNPAKIKGKRICVIDKYMGQETNYLKNLLVSNGFNLVFYENTLKDEFVASQFDVIVYVSGTGVPSSKELEFVQRHYNNGTGILLWADNDPFYGQANAILSKLQTKFKLYGNYGAQGTLKISKEKGKPGTFDIDHPVSQGFVSLYEGVTICYPNTALPSDFEVFAYSTNRNLQPSIFFRNRSTRRGALWVDTAFTKLFPSLHGTGKETTQYTLNVLEYICKKKEITPY